MRDDVTPKDETTEKPETLRPEAETAELTDEQVKEVAGGFVVKGQPVKPPTHSYPTGVNTPF